MKLFLSLFSHLNFSLFYKPVELQKNRRWARPSGSFGRVKLGVLTNKNLKMKKKVMLIAFKYSSNILDPKFIKIQRSKARWNARLKLAILGNACHIYYNCVLHRLDSRHISSVSINWNKCWTACPKSVMDTLLHATAVSTSFSAYLLFFSFKIRAPREAAH